MLFIAGNAFAQADETLRDARLYKDLKMYEKAQGFYKQLMDRNPADNDIYAEYLEVLIGAKSYKEAEKLVGSRQRTALTALDLGKVYDLEGNTKQADEQFSAVIDYLTGDDILTQRVANIFTGIGKDAWALKAYEKGTRLLSNTYIYSDAMARLYAKLGDMDKALNTLITAVPLQMNGLESTKTTLLQLLNNDADKIQKTQKVIIKRINEQPENPYYAELLTWIYTQKNDWDGAFMQIQALDERNNENGQRILIFARNAIREKQYDIAQKSYDAIIEKGKDKNFYVAARTEKLNAGLQRIQNDPEYKAEQVNALLAEYDSFFTEFPIYYGTDIPRDYALLLAQFANNPKKAIEVLEKCIASAGVRKDVIGNAKLQLGDYLLLVGKRWEASLSYSQVDKMFKQDAMGEEARFKNAKLSYYHGDFEWAQTQLKILKAATSNLISNDAIYLSVLITENTKDSIQLPLQRFAYADLLLFRNRDKEASELLDSLQAAYPEHDLRDDILMLHAKISEKHHEWVKALAYLQQIIDKYSTDVLGDDAVFKSAEIYYTYIKDNEKAKALYEKLIVDYPGSTFIQTARKNLADLNAGTPQPQ